MSDIHLLSASGSSRRAREMHDPADSDIGMPVMPREQAESAPGSVDKVLLYVTFALSALGMVAVYSASAPEAMDSFNNVFYYVQRQLVFFLMGLGLMVGIARVPYYYWARWARPIAVLVIGLLVYTLAKGVESYGAERWIRIFGFQFQPSELGKLAVVLLLAQGLGQANSRKRFVTVVINTALILVTLALVVKQPSLSMTIILSLVSAGMFFVSGTPVWLLGGLGLTGGVAVAYKIMNTEYQLRRIQGWLNPWKDPQDTGYNVIQSLYAIGSGGFLGSGLGLSVQKLHWLPFRHTDFIFSVWAEEWGFVGCVILIGLFVTLLYRGVVIARNCRSPFGQLLAMGITMMFAAQIIINLCVATGLFPVTGVTLPLISYGGTSVIVSLVMIGILLSISRYRGQIRSLNPTR